MADHSEERIVMKEDLRLAIKRIIQTSHECGVPEDGLVQLLLGWTVGHLQRGTRVRDA
jgi:hypothetical protein